MPEKELAQVKVQRFDPNVDDQARYKTYRTPYLGLTVLQALKYISENVDATLSFRYGCGGPNEVRCGACAVLVNHKPVLSCQRIAEKKMLIEPHPKFEVIRDLVTDLTRKKRRVDKRKARVEIVVDLGKCTGCRDCVLICPMEVWEVKKVGGKAIAVPVSIEDCCGSTCVQCAMHCRYQAITIVDK